MSEGYIVNAEAHDDQTITITLMYCESEEKVGGAPAYESSVCRREGRCAVFDKAAHRHLGCA
jgi:hypothetical protein